MKLLGVLRFYQGSSSRGEICDEIARRTSFLTREQFERRVL